MVDFKKMADHSKLRKDIQKKLKTVSMYYMMTTMIF